MSCVCSGDNNNCGNWLDNLIYQNWEDISQTAGQSLAYTSGYFLAASNLGKLNNSLDTDYMVHCLTGVSGNITGYTICPTMCPEVQGIYSYLYQWDFYNTQQKWALSGIGGGGATSTVTNIKEWNRSISFGGTKVEVARIFKDLSLQAKNDYIDAVKYFLKFGAVPGLVVGTDDQAGWYNGYGLGYGNYGGYSPRNFPQP